MKPNDPAYDAIGDRYEEYASAATLKQAERHSVLQMVGDLTGARILDLACGTGFYTRLFLERGARSVVGVDLSEEMVRVARRIEADRPIGASYRVGDGEHLGRLGAFDLVTAVWLLNYAESCEQLRAMARSAWENLESGGRFVAFTINPAFDYRTSESSKYGVRVVGESPEDDHVVCHGEFALDPPVAVDVRRFSTEQYEAALTDAGFFGIGWRAAGPSSDDVATHGAAYWADFRENCIGIGIVATR